MKIYTLFHKMIIFMAVSSLSFYFAYFADAHSKKFKKMDNHCNSSILKKGEGCFVYQDKSSNVSIPVYYYIPNELRGDIKILFVMHGEKRNAEDYRNDWRSIYSINNGEKSNLIVLAPQFAQNWFPKAAGYNLGNVFTEDLNILNPRSKWGFTEIENIFSFVKRSTQVNTKSYYIYGHSAGAQFVHRMVLFMPDAHIQKAVAAEAGSYMIPSEKREYPCGLKKFTGEPLPSMPLKQAFRIPMTIILGNKDNQVLSAEHDSYACDIQQGNNRLARGEYFYNQVSNIAHKRKEEFNWNIKEITAAHIVPNTNPPIEDPMLVSCAALEFFPKLTSVSCK